MCSPDAMRGGRLFRMHKKQDSAYDHRIMRDLKLPKFELGGQLAWPPHRPIDWSSAVPAVCHPGADWAIERERAMKGN